MKTFFSILLCFFLLCPLAYAYTSDSSICNPLTLPSLDLQTIALKINPTITYATLIHDDSGFRQGEVVEVIQDVANGKHYKVSNTSLCTWVNGYNLKFIAPTEDTSPETIYPTELETYINAYNNPSSTPYFVWVDLARQTIYIFTGSNHHWQLCKLFICASGKLETPTIRGRFKILDKGEELLGKERAKYWMKFHENYLFHALPLDTNHQITDSRLGSPVSNGCIRLHEEDAKCLYDMIPLSTSIWIY